MAFTYMRQSAITGDMNQMTFDMEWREFYISYRRWQQGALIQDAFPRLNDDEREFILSGMTPDEWEMLTNGRRKQASVLNEGQPSEPESV